MEWRIVKRGPWVTQSPSTPNQVTPTLPGPRRALKRPKGHPEWCVGGPSYCTRRAGASQVGPYHITVHGFGTVLAASLSLSAGAQCLGVQVSLSHISKAFDFTKGAPCTMASSSSAAAKSPAAAGAADAFTPHSELRRMRAPGAEELSAQERHSMHHTRQRSQPKGATRRGMRRPHTGRKMTVRCRGVLSPYT